MESILRKALFRLGFLIPLSPWPVFLWFAAQPEYPLGRHSASAMFSISSISLQICVGFNLIGIALVLAGEFKTEDTSEVKVKAGAIALLVMHWWIQWNWILTSSYATA
jgi:hypothetical protein